MKVSGRILILKEVKSEYFEMCEYNNHAVCKMLYHNDMVSFHDSVSFIILDYSLCSTSKAMAIYKFIFSKAMAIYKASGLLFMFGYVQNHFCESEI